MTAPARISQLDIARTMKAIRRAGVEQARIVLDLENCKIEVIIGESATADNDAENWNDEDI